MTALQPSPDGRSAAVGRINDSLPQTQCTRCGEPDCISYARAIVDGAAINRCPPGGELGIRRLAELTGYPVMPLDTSCGTEGPRTIAWIDEAACIGCTLCIKACPVDCIVGAAKLMHTVVETLCTGCELCLPACPVDCIHLEIATPGRSGWAAWSAQLAQQSRTLYERRSERIRRTETQEAQRLTARATAPLLGEAVDESEIRRQAIAMALVRARSRSPQGS